MDRLTINLNASQLTAGLAILALLYTIGLFIFRLTLDPLAKFPGPKIAAMTSWYEFYYDWWCDGRYLFEIEKMHQEYGNHSFRDNTTYIIELVDAEKDFYLTQTYLRRSDCANQPKRVVNPRPRCLQ